MKNELRLKELLGKILSEPRCEQLPDESEEDYLRRCGNWNFGKETQLRYDQTHGTFRKPNIVREQSELTEKAFMEFAKKRLEGATKISDNAKAKGGPALLTYNHFVVKLPYYEKASKGEFEFDLAKTELSNYTSTFCNLGNNVEIDQIEFQKLVGLIEVLGELIIKYRETNDKA